jgi:hypothetical protein
MPVIQVQPWGEGQGDFVLIEDYDFNPDFHRLLGEKGSAGEADKTKLTAAELKAKLTELSIEFKGNASRDALQDLLDKHEAAAVADVKTKLTEKGIDFDESADLDALKALLPAEV